MKKVSSYVLHYWYFYVLALICLFLQTGMDMISPQVTKKIVDNVIGEGRPELLGGLLLAILLIAVGRSIFGYTKELTFDYLGSKIGTDMRRNLFHHIQTLSINYFDNTNTGELMSRMKDDVDNIWAALGYIGMLIIEVALRTVLSIVCMVNISPKLAITPIAAMVVVAVIAVLMEKKLDGVYGDISEENAKLNTVAQENLAGVRTVKAFAREKHEISKFLSHNKQYYELNMKQSKVFIKYQPIVQIITRLLPVFVIVYGGYLKISGEISLGELIAFVEYATNIIWPMEMLGWLSNTFASAIASNKKIRKIYAEASAVKEKEEPVVLPEVAGSVTFDHVSLTLDEKDILKDISFELPAGKTIGIMGTTGAGKSSIISLLQRFYDASEGKIRLDGVPIRDLTLSQLRKSVSLVMQDVFLFSDTVNANVRLGKRVETTDSAIRKAIEKAQAKDFVESMEGQYETLIGERGVGLSGGQKQRISIARAFAKNAPILVMDDSTSALDMETEHEIQESLKTLNNMTKIIIAHRISAVRNADEILVLEEGKIAERGTHESLLAKKGLYYDTFMAQYGEALVPEGAM